MCLLFVSHTLFVSFFSAVTWSRTHKAEHLRVSSDGKTVTVTDTDCDHLILMEGEKITHGTYTVTVKVSIPRPNRYSFGVLTELPKTFNKGFAYKNGIIGWGLHDHTGALVIYCQTQLFAPSTLGYKTDDLVCFRLSSPYFLVFSVFIHYVI